MSADSSMRRALPARPADGALGAFAPAAWRGTTAVRDGVMGVSFDVEGESEPVRLLLSARSAAALAASVADYVGKSGGRE